LLEKAFNIITERLSGKQENKKNINKDKIFIEKNLAYKVIYKELEKKFELNVCEADKIDENNWTLISAWLFDPETDTEKQAKSIAEDFFQTVRRPQKNNIKLNKIKKKRDEDGNVDYIFFINRLANVFPELKEEINSELENYESFRQVNFTKNFICPKINFILKNLEKEKIKKIGNILNNLYNTGDLDVRSLITIIILNSIQDKNSENEILKYLSEELKKAWNAAKKFKTKKVKPEKVKKSSFMMNALKNSGSIS